MLAIIELKFYYIINSEVLLCTYIFIFLYDPLL